MSAPAIVEVRDAATVLVLRDGPGGLEVAMLRRRLESVFARGAYVFPGGAVDDDDHDVRWSSRCDGHDDLSASAALGVEAGGLAFWLAAVRECFEEAGLLLAHRADGSPLTLGDPVEADRFRHHRQAVDGGGVPLFDVCESEDLRIPVDRLHYFSHWITPEGAPRRYDTRFFVAQAPDSQDLTHDQVETIAALWTRPADALDRHGAGDFELIEPTRHSLEILAQFDAAASALAASTLLPLGMEVGR